MKTDIGPVSQDKGNEDNLIAIKLLIDKGPDRGEYNLLLLADGMGGLEKGELASALTIKGIIKHFINKLVTDKGKFFHSEINMDPAELLKECIEMANLLVYNVGKRDKSISDIGSTIVAGLIKNGKFFIAHVGDSRAYLIRKNNIEKLTTDHSLVQALYESHLINTSEIYQHPHKNVITRAIGFSPKVEVEINKKRNGKPVTLQEHDIILLCSDGVSNVMEEQEILYTVKNHISNPQLIADELINLANLRKSDDNLTILCALIQARDIPDSIPISVIKSSSPKKYKPLQTKIPTVVLTPPDILCPYCSHKNLMGDINCSYCGKSQIFISRKPHIVILDGPDKGKRIEMDKEEIYIGREDSNDMVIQEPKGREFISRKHVKISKHNNEYWIEDLNSSNGTKIKGQQIRGKKVKLQNRELIVLGMNTLEFII